MSLAASFATSTAGYITGIGTPVVCIIAGGVFNRLFARLGKQDAALSELAQAVAVVVSEGTGTKSTVAGLVTDVVDLKTAVAVLKDARVEHDRWAATEKQGIERTLRGYRPPSPA